MFLKHLLLTKYLFLIESQAHARSIFCNQLSQVVQKLFFVFFCFFTAFGSWAPGVVWDCSKSKQKPNSINRKPHHKVTNSHLSWVNFIGLWTSWPMPGALLLGLAKSIYYTWMEIGAMRVTCLAQEHNAMSLARIPTLPAWSGVKPRGHHTYLDTCTMDTMEHARAY